MNLKKQLYLILSYISILLIVGCEYETDEKYFKEVDPTIKYPEVIINLPFNKDTVYTYPSSNDPNHYYVSIDCIVDNNEVYKAIFFVDNEAIDANRGYYSVDKLAFGLPIDFSNKLENQIKVRAELYFSTETGSLADKTQNEVITYTSKEWVIVREPKPVLTTSIEDGRLKLSWPPTKNGTNTLYYVKYDDIIDSTTNNWYIDSSFIGGYRRFNINASDYKLSTYYLETEIFYTWPKLSVTNNDSCVINLENLLFYNNITKLQILNKEKFVIPINKNATSYTLKNWIFGDNLLIQLLVFPYKQSKKVVSDEFQKFWLQGSYVFELNFLKGMEYGFLRYPLFGQDFYIQDHTIGEYNMMEINKFSLDQKRRIYSLKLKSQNQFIVSPNDKYIITCDQGDNLTLIRSSDLQIVKTIPADNFIPYGSIRHRLTDDAITLYYDWNRKALIRYDLINDQITHTITVNSTPIYYSYEISSDGQYIFNITDNSLLKITEDSYTTIWHDASNTPYQYCVFSPIKPDEIYVYDGENLYLKSCTDFSTFNSFSLNNQSMVNIDFNKRKIMTLKDKSFFIYSLDNGELLQTVSTVYSQTSGDYIHLFNDYIIKSDVQYNLNNNK